MKVIRKSSLEKFEPYVNALEEITSQAVTYGLNSARLEEVTAILDGQPGSAMRTLVPLDVRRTAGAFFTGSELASRAIQPHVVTVPQNAAFLDPACGVGDLLVACARRLPIDSDLKTTLTKWGQRLYGFDVFPEFIRAARARLALLAVERGAMLGVTPLPPLEQIFPNIKTIDGLSISAAITASQAATHIVLNPPYSKIPAPGHCTWGSGKVSTAAIFLDDYLAHAQAGTKITAILPDVLRSGSLYQRWRMRIEEHAKVEDIDVVGLFDEFADVDVFILRLVVGAEKNNISVTWWSPKQPANCKSIGDLFDVRVGPVVPHRDPKCGQWHPYIHVRLLPKWETFDADSVSRRRYWGKVFTPPFVVVRRTSAPGDKNRAIATIVTGSAPVAVENHLIVLNPRNNSLSRCHQLLRVLHSESADKWLDERIRCRHLTVSALRDLPWWSI